MTHEIPFPCLMNQPTTRETERVTKGGKFFTFFSPLKADSKQGGGDPFHPPSAAKEKEDLIKTLNKIYDSTQISFQLRFCLALNEYAYRKSHTYDSEKYIDLAH